MYKADEDSADILIHRRFEDRARLDPRALALVHGERTLTYGELDAWAERLAHRLRAAGVGPESAVGIHLERSPEAVGVVLAVWKAGGAYVPLDPAQPAQRLAHIIEDCAPHAVVTSARLADGLPPHTAEPILVDREAAPAAGAGREAARNAGVRPDNLAYVIYTSGSTGRPKGVEVSHRGLLTSYEGWRQVYRLDDEVRSHLQVAGFSFDVSTGDFARALLSGGTLVLCDQRDLLMPENLHRLIIEHDIHMMDITPAILRLLMDHLERSGGRLDRMRLITVGGEAWPRRDHARLRRLVGPDTRVFCSYGVTESSVDSTCFDTSTDHGSDGDSMPIGHAFPGTRTLVLGADLDPADPGGEGELYLTGAGLARGYHGRPARTALRFLPAPGGRRMYRTGDRARTLPDDAVEHLGRVDDEVKVNGVRIQPAEIEAALRTHPSVGHAVTVATRERGTIRLHAYVTPAGTAPVTPEEVARHARQVLPAAMVPATVTVLDRLPLNTNGKVDRHRLPAPVTAAGGDDVHEAPKGDVEIRLAAIWREVLGTERVGALDDFLQLGGDSLQAARVGARIRSDLGVDIPAGAALAHPTVRELAAHVDRLTPENDPPSVFAAPEGRYPLSPTQRRLWLLNLITGPDPTYNIPMAFSAHGALDLGALATAVDRIVRRHAPLRTRIDVHDGEPTQQVLPQVDIPVETADLRDTPDPEGRAAALSAQQVREPFDLTDGPLIRVLVLRTADRVHQVLVTVHHIVFDGWSAEILLRELGEEYTAALHGAAPGTVGPALSYGDLSAWRDRRRGGPEHAAHLDYWKRKFRTIPPRLDTLADRSPDTSAGAGGAGRVTRFLDPTLTTAVRTLGQTHSSTLFVTLLSAFTVLLGRLSTEHDIAVGTPISGRDREETHDLIGFFINTVVIRADLSGTPSFDEVLGRVRNTVLEAHAHQDVPFDEMVAAVAAERVAGRNPLFQTWFNLLGGPDQPPRMPGLETRMTEVAAHAALFDLGLYVTDHGDRLRLDLAYDTSLFGDARAHAVLEQFTLVLEQATARPHARCIDLTLVTEAHRKVLPDPAADLAPRPVVDLAHGLRTGMTTSVVRDAGTALDGVRLRELTARADRNLAAHGVHGGQTVAVYAARNAALVPLLLGIRERGAAFLVLDPAHPTERLLAQTEAAAATLLIHCEEAGILPAGLRDTGTPVVTAGALLDGTDGPSPSTAVVRPDDSHPAYVMFTSGSTGPVPRGVVGTAAPLAHFLTWYTETFGLGSDDRFALLSGLGHDPLLRDLLTPLWTGGELHVPGAELLRNPALLLRWLAERRTTVLHVTPPLARLLTVAAEENGTRLPDLRLVCYGGDILRHPDVTAFAAVAPGARHVNLYGATETPQGMAYHIVSPTASDPAEPAAPHVPIGTGIDDVQILVLNEGGQLCGIGEIGELVVRTPFLAVGYLEPAGPGGFHSDPAPGVRRYATGDLGRYLPDGTVGILGRRDAQVKIRGFRVDPAEVTRACERLPGVRSAATLTRRHGDGETRLVTYLVTAEGPGPTAERVRAALEAVLPEYMVPSELMEISRMPLTPNGKIDTGALLASVPADRPEDRAPDGELEEAVRAIWQDVLPLSDGAPAISSDDNFFDLGGTSRMMVQVQAELRKRLGLDVSLVTLFRHASMGALARHLRGTGNQDAVVAEPDRGTPPRRRDRRRDSALARAERLARRGGRP